MDVNYCGSEGIIDPVVFSHWECFDAIMRSKVHLGINRHEAAETYLAGLINSIVDPRTSPKTKVVSFSEDDVHQWAFGDPPEGQENAFPYCLGEHFRVAMVYEANAEAHLVQAVFGNPIVMGRVGRVASYLGTAESHLRITRRGSGKADAFKTIRDEIERYLELLFYVGREHFRVGRPQNAEGEKAAKAIVEKRRKEKRLSVLLEEYDGADLSRRVELEREINEINEKLHPKGVKLQDLLK